MHTFIDLFCGIGGFRRALEKNGLECGFSCDVDKNAMIAYKENFGESPFCDITLINPSKHIPKHDILCAGFPCQPFSISGKMEGFNTQNGQLIRQVFRIVEYHKPLILLLENVKNILNIDNGNVVKEIEDKLNEIGYIVEKHVLNASYFGVPQARERVYFVCIRKDLTQERYNKITYHKPKETNKKIYLQDILEKDVDSKLWIERDDIVLQKTNIVDKKLEPIKVGYVNKGGQGERIYSALGHAITISAQGGGVGAKTGLYQIDDRIRRLSVTETKRVMGFGDKHFVCGGVEGYKQLGNAVIPSMIDFVYNSIKIA